MTQFATTMMSKSLADENRSRDVRRRIEVIHKKLADLQELGIPCAFCYSSARNTGSIFTLGDSRITDVIERHKNEILVNLSGDNSEQNEGNKTEIHLILPPLPLPLEELNRHTLQSMIVGIIKDLRLRWTDPTPSWWPLDVPFVHPRSMPQSFFGNLVQALRKVLESVYSYFSYDVTKYIANQLEQETESTNTCHVSRVQPQAEMDPESEETTPNVRSPKITRDSGEATVEKKPPTRTLSNFTVENILMSHPHNSSNSSHSPSSTSTGSSLTSPIAEYSSILPGNWISHPPVKYTKYTMLSPGSMGDEKAAKKKQSNISETTTTVSSNSRQRHHSSSIESTSSSSESHKLMMRRVPSNPIVRVPSGEQLHYTFTARPTSGNNGHHVRSKLVSSDDTKPIQMHSFTQSHPMITTKSVSTLPVIQAIPYSSSVGKSAVLQQNFPPTQQFVLLVPSTTANVGDGLQAVVYANQTQLSTSSRSTKSSLSEQTSELNSLSHNHPSTDTDKRLLETYRPIAPKSKLTPFREISTVSASTALNKKAYKRSPIVGKPQKLRFHMTTVVKRPKHSVMTSSMTVDSPSTINQRTKTTSFIMDSHPSAETLAEKHITKAQNNYSNEKLTADDSSNAETAADSPQSIASNDESNAHSINEARDHPPSQSPGADSTDSKKDKLTFIHCHEDKQFEDNGRTTRSYTRRKRELTFHLYEDPETAFKAKRNCKE